jgi:L,D-transpeptidase ErfK/SrfK
MKLFLTTVIVMASLFVVGAQPNARAAEPITQPTRLIGGLETTVTKYEDTLVHLARKYNVGFVEMRAANPGVDPWLPGAGVKITVPTQHIIPDAPHKGVVINLPEMRMYFFFDPNEPPATYPIGIGRSGLTTPLGPTTIARMSIDPVWRPTDRMRAEDPTLPAVVPPGPENPMGTHSLYLGWPSYAIHGTDKPYSIGRRLSSGCIRMYPEDIITLYDNVKVGTDITVVDQPVKTAWVDGQYYVQVHPTQEQSDLLSHDGMTKPDYPLREDDIQKIIKGAGEDAALIDWVKMRAVVKERRGIPVVIASKNTGVKNQPADQDPPLEKSVNPDPAQKQTDIKKEGSKKEGILKEKIKKETSSKEKPVTGKTKPIKEKTATKKQTVSKKPIPKDGVSPAYGVKPKILEQDKKE